MVSQPKTSTGKSSKSSAKRPARSSAKSPARSSTKSAPSTAKPSPTSSPTSSQDDLAVRLALAIKHIRSRVLERRPANVKSLSLAQIAIIKRLRDGGPTTAASLAVAEHVSQQAIAQQIAALRTAGLVNTAPDTGDGRKLLVSVTKAGLKVFDAARESDIAWLVQAISITIAVQERSAFANAIAMLERIAVAGSE